MELQVSYRVRAEIIDKNTLVKKLRRDNKAYCYGEHRSRGCDVGAISKNIRCKHKNPHTGCK